MGRNRLKVFLAIALVLLGVTIAMGVTDKRFIVRSFSPKGAVVGRAQIKAVFSFDVVSADDVGRNLDIQEQPFVFSPQIIGEGQWTDSKTFVFSPIGDRLQTATQYTAQVNPSLRDLEGRSLSGKKSFAFNTAPLEFVGASQTGLNDNGKRVYYDLDFSLPVSSSRLSGYLSLRSGSRELDVDLRQGSDSRKAVLIAPYFEGEAELTITKDFPPNSGTLGLEKDVKVKLRPSLTMIVLDANTESGTQTSQIIINTSAQVDFARAESFIEVTPKKEYTLEPNGNGFVIDGNFEPQDRITVTIKKGFPSLPGSVLEKDWTRTFVFPDKRPQVSLEVSGRVITPSGSLRLPIESVNLDKIKVEVWKLYENNIPVVMKNEWESFPTDLSARISSKSYTVAGKPNETVRRALDLKPIVSGDRGVFMIYVSSEEEGEWADDHAVLNVTDLGVTTKTGPNSVFAWVNSIQTGEPVYGAKVTFWSWANQPVAEATTDIRGVVAAELSDDQSKRPVLATVSKAGDVAFVRLGSGLFGGKDEFDTTGREWVYSGYSAYTYLPHDIFRPGDTVPFRVVVRDANDVAPKPFPLTVKITTPAGKEWGERTAKLTNSGTFAVDVEFPRDVPVGVWRAMIFAPGSTDAIGYKEFIIEEFAPPRLFVETSADKKRLIGEDSGKLSISSRYAFGGSASALPWETTQSVYNKTFQPEGWGGYSFYDFEAEKTFSPESEHIGSGKLDSNGKALAEIKSRAWPVSSMAQISVRTGVMEEGGRWVYETTNLDWYPKPVMLGISMPNEIKPGAVFEFGVAAVTPDGKAATIKKANYKILRVIHQDVVYMDNGRRRVRSQKELLESAKGEIRLKNGMGSGSFKPPQGGSYILRIEDPACGAKASSNFYTHQSYYSDRDETKETNLPDSVELVTDKKEYKAGEVVKVKVKSPFSGQLLLGVETYKMVHRVVRDMKGGEETEISFRANEYMFPNAWITAQVIKPAKKGGSHEPLRAYGVAPLMMDNRSSKLTVDIDKVGGVEPGPLDVNITVKGASGRGAVAEVTVMLVDETVLGLTGWQRADPWGYFTARRKLGMETYDLYGGVISPEEQTTPLLTPGGDGYASEALAEARSLNPVQTQRFKILSLTKTVQAAGNGKATVHFNVPEFAGTVRLTAVAVSAKAMGSGDDTALINREIVLEPSLPRALAPGDVLTAPLTIFNMASRDIGVNMTVTPSGPIKLSGDKKFTVNIKKGQSLMRELTFTGTGYGVAKVSYTAEWRGGKIADMIELPVRPAAPRVSENKSMILEAGKSEKMNMGGEWLPGTRSGRVMLSAMPQISMAEVAQYLITYPYGCLEQTVSSAWPVLLMPELVAAVDPTLATKQSLAGSLAIRVTKIRALQNHDGGFSRWQGQGWSHSWDSMYAAHLLLEAKKRGSDIPQANITLALNFVRQQLNSAPQNDSAWAWKEALTRRAYACYVLAIAGEKQLGWMSSLYDREDELSPAARLMLAAAYGAAGEKKQATKMLGKSLEVIKFAPGGNDVYDSNLRNRALLLLAWTHIDPVSPESTSAAFGLLNNFKTARYYTTQEGGFATLALARYFSAQPAEGKPAGAIRDASGKTIAELSEKTRIISADVGKQDTFTMANSGKSRLFTASTVSGVPTKPVAAVDSGIKIRQTLRDRAGNEIKNVVSRGELLTATVEITPTAGSLLNLVVVIPLAAGLEVENPRLTGGEGELPPNARVELRDDRVLLFIDRISETMKWNYSVRPVTAGKFVVPKFSAECMYDPAVQSISGGGGTLEIKNAD